MLVHILLLLVAFTNVASGQSTTSAVIETSSVIETETSASATTAPVSTSTPATSGADTTSASATSSPATTQTAGNLPILGAQDCEEHGQDVCPTMTHEGKNCYWSCEHVKCEGAEPNDMEQYCKPYCEQGACELAGNCFWNHGEGDFGKCVYAPNGQYKGDCEDYSKEQCSGKMHEGKACYWDCEELQCEEAEIGNSDHICEAKCTASSCEQTDICVWDAAEGDFGKCLLEADAEYDCEDYTNSTQCGTKLHEGKHCYWDCESWTCEQGDETGNEHICDSLCGEEACATRSDVCFMEETSCKAYSSLQQNHQSKSGEYTLGSMAQLFIIAAGLTLTLIGLAAFQYVRSRKRQNSEFNRLDVSLDTI